VRRRDGRHHQSCLAQYRVRGIALVIDGDAIEIAKRRIRLNGIDAPETGQTCNNPRGGTFACGTDAATMLADLIGKAEVTFVLAA
jgi:endonuclease YncB( thermonuclease family)